MEHFKPHYAEEAEINVLGAIMLEPDIIGSVSGVLAPEMFYSRANQLIYKAMTSLFINNYPIDIVSVSETLNDDGDLDKAGGREYINYLTLSVITTANVEYYADLVAEKAKLRALTAVGHQISRCAMEESDADLVMQQAQQRLFDVCMNGNKAETLSLKDILPEAIASMEKAQAGNRAMTGVSTGFYKLDSTLAGLQSSDLLILAARPSMGKTALALNISANVAKEKPVVLFSLEMSKEQLINRILCAESEIDAQRIRTCQLTEMDLNNLKKASEKIKDWKLFIDDSSAVSVMDIRTKSRKIMMQTGEALGLIVIDYIQLMAGLAGKGVNPVQEVAAISRGLKALARDLKVPVLALSQLSRAVESRTDKRPMLSDLRESGAIEQDADVVMFVYRDEYYNRDTPTPGVAEIIVSKQRNGPLGNIPLLFRASTTRFLNPVETNRVYSFPSLYREDF